jgi:hypothetical protein
MSNNPNNNYPRYHVIDLNHGPGHDDDLWTIDHIACTDNHCRRKHHLLVPEHDSTRVHLDGAVNNGTWEHCLDHGCTKDHSRLLDDAGTTEHDPWPGDDYDGTSVLHAAQHEERGECDDYRCGTEY